MILEVIATTLTDAAKAEAGGADRIELATALAEGGLTPSWGLVERTALTVSIPIQVMIRPHSRSFVYDVADVLTMLADIRAVRAIRERVRDEAKKRRAADGGEPPAFGIALGCLTRAGRIDETVLQRLLEEAGDLDVTFHRAFDETADLEEAYKTLSRYPGVRRVLTSGGKPSAPDSAVQLRRLVELGADSHVQIMAGGGLTPETLPVFLRDTGVREVHVGKAARGARGLADPVLSGRVRALKRAMGETRTPP
ncbi:copper homeostasis protein CutC [Paenibacillus thermoaerophilus]|uniref:PF03932 family protein CutC n=1 Tax=Paenibacillus thermoaerophilus TaxID=1215385 RepID=A0ABW2V5Y3_9BACL|nr:copper homeostasis protein CutC [Paenibacillus thermoaerophilus]TMV17676.1 copper homeostasis protein CutC [Paenibacillus thermoaerophilus]